MVAATASDDHLTGGIDCLIAHAQYDQLISARISYFGTWRFI
jgi:hypothetical protein